MRPDTGVAFCAILWQWRRTCRCRRYCSGLFARVLHWPMALAAPAVTATMLAVNFLSAAGRSPIRRARTVGMSS